MKNKHKNPLSKLLLLLFAFLMLIGVLIVILSVEKNTSLPPLAGGKKGNGLVTTYPFAAGMDKFKGMSVYVQDSKETHSLTLYGVNTNPKRNYPAEASLFKKAAVAMFDMKGTISIAVVYPKGIKSVSVRPAKAGIIPHIKGNTVSFDISKWGQYSVEFNGDPTTDDLLIFANPPDETPPAHAKIIKGTVNGDLTISNNETVYMEPGSVINGEVVMGSNSRLLGRGILTQGGPPAIDAESQTNITINGIAIFDPNDWGAQFLDSDNIKMENVKLISCRDNSDGITIQSSRNVSISDSFVRSWDDSIVLKNYTQNNTYNVKVTNCVLWTDLAQSLEIGFETDKGGANVGYSPSPNTDPQIHDISFENIDILHAFHKAPISIHNADNCQIYNVSYKNIIIEDAEMGVPGSHGEGGGWPYLIDFDNGSSSEMGGDASWTTNDGNRSIKNILVENVWVLGGKKSSCTLHLLNQNSGGASVMDEIQLKNIYFEKQPLDYTNAIKSAKLTSEITQTNAPYFSWTS